MEPVLIEDHGRVRVLRLNRPERLNAFTAAMHATLRRALDGAATDEGVGTVMLTGAGRAFSSGQDLTEDLPRNADGAVDLSPALARDYNPLIERLAAFPKPVVAAINGPAVGAAMNIALACDIAVAAHSASLQQAFVRIGLIPDAGGTWLLPRLVGTRRALALMLTGEVLEAPAALDLGLVHKVFADESFEAEALAFAARLADGPPLAMRLMREAVTASWQNDLAGQLALEADFQTRAGRSADFAEGIRAFREKRKPRFGGRTDP